MLKAVLASAFLFPVLPTSAARMSLARQRSEINTMDATRTNFMELDRLQSQVHFMDSTITEVQKALHSAFLEFKQLAPEKAHAAKKTHLSKHKEKKELSAKILTNTTSHSAKSDEKGGLAGKHGSNNSSQHVMAVSVKAKVKAEQSVLEKLFKHLKSNVVKLNKQDSERKKVSEEAVQRLQARLKKDKAESERKDASAFEHELAVNRTRTDEVELRYWTQDRSLGHQMFHDNLKVTHGLMGRVKSVIDACKEAAAKGHVDADLLKKVKAQSLQRAFVQMHDDLEYRSQVSYHEVLTGPKI